MSLLCSTDTLREEADCIACDGYVTTSRRLEDAADEIDQLRAKNSKLRELVRELYYELDAATQYEAGGGRGVVSEFACHVRELGVEMDE